MYNLQVKIIIFLFDQILMQEIDQNHYFDQGRTFEIHQAHLRGLVEEGSHGGF